MELHNDDVIFMDANNSLLNCAAAKFGDIQSGAVSHLNGHLAHMARYGVNCEMLKPGQNWVKGKLKARIVFEFEPDDSTT